MISLYCLLEIQMPSVFYEFFSQTQTILRYKLLKTNELNYNWLSVDSSSEAFNDNLRS